MPPKLRRFVKVQRTAWIIVGFVMLAIAAVGAQYENRQRIKADEQLTREVHELAVRADAKAQQALIANEFQARKVCSTTLAYQESACRDLFERLVRNISARQRFRLACTMAYELRDPFLTGVRRRARCPAPSGVRSSG